MTANPCLARPKFGFDVLEKEISLNLYRSAGKSFPFVVLPNVYQPDEWTEIALEAALTTLNMFPKAVRIHDIGTGSGVIPLLLNRLYPDRQFHIVCCDLKAAAGRNLELNYHLFGEASARPHFHQLDIRKSENLPAGDGPPDLIIANIPQLPAILPTDDGRWNPDDYYAVDPGDRDDPVGAFGLRLLMDVISRTNANHPGRFHAAFCRSSRVPAAVFEEFLNTVGGTVIAQGCTHRVKDSSTPFALMAEAEDRFGFQGEYELDGRPLSAGDLRALSPVQNDIFIGLRSCLVRIG